MESRFSPSFKVDVLSRHVSDQQPVGEIQAINLLE